MAKWIKDKNFRINTDTGVHLWTNSKELKTVWSGPDGKELFFSAHSSLDELNNYLKEVDDTIQPKIIA